MRPLRTAEVEEVLALDVPAHLATIRKDGFPRVTPIWFVWEDGAFYMTSVEGRKHLEDLARESKAAICVDVEDKDNVRANRSVRASGLASLATDVDGEWTRRITLKYMSGEAGEMRARERAAMKRVVVELRPRRLVGRGT